MSFILSATFAAPRALLNFFVDSYRPLFSFFARFVPAWLPSFPWRWSATKAPSASPDNPHTPQPDPNLRRAPNAATAPPGSSPVPPPSPAEHLCDRVAAAASPVLDPARPPADPAPQKAPSPSPAPLPAASDSAPAPAPHLPPPPSPPAASDSAPPRSPSLQPASPPVASSSALQPGQSPRVLVDSIRRAQRLLAPFQLPDDSLSDQPLIEACLNTFDTIMRNLPSHLSSPQTTRFLERLSRWESLDLKLSYIRRALTYFQRIPSPLPRGFGIDLRSFTFRVPDNGDCFYIAIVLGMLFYPELERAGIAEHLQLRTRVVDHLNDLFQARDPGAINAITQSIADYCDSERDKQRFERASLPTVIRDLQDRIQETGDIITALAGLETELSEQLTDQLIQATAELNTNQERLRFLDQTLARPPEESHITTEEYLRLARQPRFFAGAAEMYAITRLFPTVHLIVQQAESRAYMAPYDVEAPPFGKPHVIRLLLSNQHFRTGAPRLAAPRSAEGSAAPAASRSVGFFSAPLGRVV